MIVPHFLAMGHSSWVEIHWTKAATFEQAEMVRNSLGLSGEIYRMTFHSSKNSDGFFAWWVVKGSNDVQTQETNQMPEDG